MTKIISLSRNQVALVDDWNYEWISQYTWYARFDRCTGKFYAQRMDKKTRTTIYMAREIMKTPKGLFCDHINLDTLDNREENLRNVTRSQNGMNRHSQDNNRLGEKDIKVHGSGFEVRIRVGKKVMFDKTFRNLDDAIVARNEAITKYHGEFGNWNTKND